MCHHVFLTLALVFDQCYCWLCVYVFHPSNIFLNFTTLRWYFLFVKSPLICVLFVVSPENECARTSTSTITTFPLLSVCIVPDEQNRWTKQMNEKHSTLWHFPCLSPLSSSTSAQLSSVCFICESVRLAVLPRHSRPLSPRPPPLFSSMSRPPSQDKSDLRSSVIQNTDTIWSAAHSEYSQSLPWKLKIFPY